MFVRRCFSLLFVCGLAATLAGCGLFQRPERPAWRGRAEAICLAEKRVQPTANLRMAPAIDGPGICGLDHPFKVTALADDTVMLDSTQTLGCPMVAGLEQWVRDSVQPAAMARFGVAVARIKSMGSYSCRSIDNISGAKLSEHSFGNAMDVGGFVLADGREINVMRGWRGPDEQVRAFLREVQAGACGVFTTVLAPGADVFHYNHIHLDLAMHGNTSTGPRRICKPVPPAQLVPPPGRRDDLPDPPAVDEELAVARGGGTYGGMHSLALGAPTPLPTTRVPLSTRRLSAIAPPPPRGRAEDEQDDD